MRCPKCHYLSFDPEPRCRNCGYDFALAQMDLEDDLDMKAADEPAALADLDLQLRAATARPSLQRVDADLQPVRRVSAAMAAAVAIAEPAIAEAPVEAPLVYAPEPAAAPAPRAVPVRSPNTTTELPLFVRGLPPAELPGEHAPAMPAMDVPLVLVPPAPRPPLAVRRRSPDPAPPSPPSSLLIAPGGPPRSASPFSGLASARSGGAEHGRLLEIQPAEPVWAPLPAEEPPGPARSSHASSPERARPKQRLLAALVDAALLSAIDAGIVWFTLRICALTIGQVATSLPLLPLAAFCVLLDVGYMLMFTATSGQTVGKMAAGIRVVGGLSELNAGGPVTVRQAVLRTLLALPSLAAAGAGLLPALLGRGPAVHDRLAHTRVVRS